MCTCVYLSPQVGSVEEFQGQERKIVMVTTVRSSINYVKMDQDFNIGFLANEKVCQLFRYIFRVWNCVIVCLYTSLCE